MALKSIAKTAFAAAAFGPILYGIGFSWTEDHTTDWSEADASKIYEGLHDPDVEYGEDVGFDWGSYFSNAFKLAGDGYKWELDHAVGALDWTWDNINSFASWLNSTLADEEDQAALTPRTTVATAKDNNGMRYTATAPAPKA